MSDRFKLPSDTLVVTSSYVTEQGLPILLVSHDDDEGASLWQFHCGNGDYSMEHVELVRIDTILSIDNTVSSAANLKLGETAARETINSPWIVASS